MKSMAYFLPPIFIKCFVSCGQPWLGWAGRGAYGGERKGGWVGEEKVDIGIECIRETKERYSRGKLNERYSA